MALGTPGNPPYGSFTSSQTETRSGNAKIVSQTASTALQTAALVLKTAAIVFKQLLSFCKQLPSFCKQLPSFAKSCQTALGTPGQLFLYGSLAFSDRDKTIWKPSGIKDIGLSSAGGLSELRLNGADEKPSPTDRFIESRSVGKSSPLSVAHPPPLWRHSSGCIIPTLPGSGCISRITDAETWARMSVGDN
ncbi:hypothetical protein OH77DRAFT_949855 [Trametes cingulata]|nr:hypothetical protein OH77DRAFT_949855 [Trametes cingulata]